MKQLPSSPTATYRLQFSHKFRFVDATRIIPYLAKLGIDTLYASPYFRARPGSEHGYDVIDHNVINPEIGTPQEHKAMIELAQSHGIGHLVDFVPNHMGIGEVNPWWRDVLMWGESSPYAKYFDINWVPLRKEEQGRLLLASLGDLYGAVLERGELQLDYVADRAEFVIRYFDKLWPLRIRSYASVLEHLASAASLADTDLAASLQRLIANFRDHGDNREKTSYLLAELKECLEFPPFGRALKELLARSQVTPEQPENADWLDELLGDQFYRLTYWRIARDEINYRRFFDVNELAGLRVENQAVLEDTHRLIFHLIDKGMVQGLRIDHIDGLRHPATYCRYLREVTTDAQPALYLVVEKILARFENLNTGWQVDGTTGYEFSTMVAGVSVDGTAEERFSRIYRAFSGLERDFKAVAQEAKRLVMRTMLASELTVLATLLARIATSDRASVDFTFTAIRDALSEVVAGFPVYRTYISDGEISEKDASYIEWAIKLAKKAAGPQDEQIFTFIHETLTLRLLGLGREYVPEQVLNFVQKFQQYTSPVMAKAVEDTSFYRYVRLLSLNEVGGDPSRFGVSPNDFHRFCSDRAEKFPLALSATATHDHKRGEDVRMRLNVLTEMPEVWRRSLNVFARYSGRSKGLVNDSPAPSANDEYALYQTLLGTWPCAWLNGVPAAAEDREVYAARIEAYMQKFVREAKLRSSWMNVDEAYERATFDFARRLLDPAKAATFQRVFLELAQPVARLGMLNSLAQLALKSLAPGVPDLYQGGEMWDLSLVDPDNRTPVDFAAREALLESFAAALETQDPASYASELLESWHDGRIKFFVLWRLLQIRKQHRDTVLSDEYKPLKVNGRRNKHVMAFMRRDLIVVTPRLLRRLAGAGTRVVINEGYITIPKAAAAYTDLVTGEVYRVERGQLRLAQLFTILPFAILAPADEPEAAA